MTLAEVVAKRLDDSVSLLVLVDELTLSYGPDIQLAAVTPDTELVVVLVVLGQVADL